MTREEQIQKFMKSLDISYEEAEQLLEDDEEDFIGEEGEQMQTKAKKLKRYEKAETSKERKPKERKIDLDKKALLDLLAKGLAEGGITATAENEVRLHFNQNGIDYTVTLTKHRKAKV